MKKGFTLIELLITLSIIAIVLAIAIPVSYTTYKGYRESLEAQKVLMLLSSIKRESFLYFNGCGHGACRFRWLCKYVLSLTLA